MSYKVIEIPGGTTINDECPTVTMAGGGDSPLRLIIRYDASRYGETSQYGEIDFPHVYEFHYIAEDFAYERHEEHQGDYKLGLIEVDNSAYVEEMAAKGDLGHLGENRFGERIPESSVKHYRMIFDHYGRFDVIAQDVIVRAIR